jgi:hypothetical protein
MVDRCPIGTRERLADLLAGKLPAAERRRLAAHLDDACPTCLDLLEEMDAEALLTAAVGPAAEMSPEETDRVFAAAIAPSLSDRPADAGPPRRGSAWLRPSRGVPLAAAAALLLASLVGIALWAPDGGRTADYTGIKAAGDQRPRPPVALRAFAGARRDGRPRVGRRLLDGDAVQPDEAILLRYRLAEPAFVYLLAAGPGLDTPLVHAGELRQAAGEHELSAGKRALALAADRFGDRIAITLWACSAPLPAAAHTDAEALRLAASAAGPCAAASLHLRVEAEP